MTLKYFKKTIKVLQQRQYNDFGEKKDKVSITVWIKLVVEYQVVFRQPYKNKQRSYFVVALREQIDKRVASERALERNGIQRA